MKVSELIRRLLMPVALIAVMCVAGTFAAAYFGGQSHSLDWFLRKLDLRREANIATWFESSVFLLCGMSFALLGWKRDNEADVPTFSRYVFLLAALASCLASADETAGIHENLGARVEKTTGILNGSSIEGSGYGWVLLYSPVVLTALAIMAWALLRLISRMPGPKADKRWAKVFLLAAVIAVPSVLLLETSGGYYEAHGHWSTILPCLEESTEFVVLFGFLGCNAYIARNYDL